MIGFGIGDQDVIAGPDGKAAAAARVSSSPAAA
jgi:hypothetical protein